MTISVIKTALFSSLASCYVFLPSAQLISLFLKKTFVDIGLLYFVLRPGNVCSFTFCGTVSLYCCIYGLNDNKGLPHKTVSRYCPFDCLPTEGSDPFSSFYRFLMLFFVFFSLSLFFSFLSIPSTFLLTLSPKEDRALLFSER
jgi:hypothetical protein